MARKKKKKSRPSLQYRIFIDYENSPDCLKSITDYECEEVWSFVGRQQKKIPLELVQQVQSLGRSVHWVAPGAVGKNALDFILAMQVGFHHAQADRDLAFAIFSADKGYDPLITELAKEDRTVIRVDPTRSASGRRRRKKIVKAKAVQPEPRQRQKKKKKKKTQRSTIAELTDRVEDRLVRMTPERLPSKKKNLLKHVESQLPATEKEKTDSVVEALKRRKIIKITASTGQVHYPGL